MAKAQSAITALVAVSIFCRSPIFSPALLVDSLSSISFDRLPFLTGETRVQLDERSRFGLDHDDHSGRI
jgi:hypothetical protein